MIGYVLKYESGQYLNYDHQYSGGYPYPVEEVWRANIFLTKEDAIKALRREDNCAYCNLQNCVFEISFEEQAIIPN